MRTRQWTIFALMIGWIVVAFSGCNMGSDIGQVDQALVTVGPPTTRVGLTNPPTTSPLLSAEPSVVHLGAAGTGRTIVAFNSLRGGVVS